MKRSPNFLIRETSPYLLQHAYNPVQWYPWGKEALSRAKNENKLILISIGYAACHWCHVMEKESFEDEHIAQLMNDNFICIKVDREERPDLDQVYMSAVQLMSGSGGWPLNCFLTPAAKPFYGGTYFPPDQFSEVLMQLTELWRQEPSRVNEHADSLCEGIKNSELIREKNQQPVSLTSSEITKQISKEFDTLDGGLNRIPKFPMPSLYRYLLAYHQIHGSEEALQHVQLTMDKMLRGGIYDQLAGGIARYSTDRNWFIPHFEKMLYDNAQFVSLLSELHMVSHKKHYAEAIHQTLAFINDNLQDENSAFYSSIDADSEGVEGAFYTWHKDEIAALAGEHVKMVFDHFGIRESGNWENNRNVLSIKEDYSRLSNRYNLEEETVASIITLVKEEMLKKRMGRPHPLIDDKILTSWNALMIMALTDAWQATSEYKYYLQAKAAGEFILEHMMHEGAVLLRSYGRTIPGFLDDYAFTAEAFIKLYQAEFEEKWLMKAKELVDYCLDHFYDREKGMFFYNPDSELNPVARQSEVSDSVIPSSNSSMSFVLFDLSLYFDNPLYKDISEQMLKNVTPLMHQSPTFFSNWARRLLLRETGDREIIISGAGFREKRGELCGHYLPFVLLAGSPGISSMEIQKGKYREGTTLLYACKNKTCRQPVEDSRQALKELDIIRES